MTETKTQEQHFEAIRREVDLTRFSRKLHDRDEIVDEVYLYLLERGKLPVTGPLHAGAIVAAIRPVLRKARSDAKDHADIDEVDHDEHPSYTMEGYRRAENFEKIFADFCRSMPAPKSLIYSLHLKMPKRRIARALGMNVHTVLRIIDEMENDLKNYLEKIFFE